jgi:hypothetical protein
VTVSDKAREKVKAWVGLYVASAGPVTIEIVGAVRSIVIIDEASEFDAGPFVLVPVPKTESASSWGIKVPSPHEETVKVKEIPDEALGEKLQPVAVPLLEKSLDATEFTF